MGSLLLAAGLSLALSLGQLPASAKLLPGVREQAAAAPDAEVIVVTRPGSVRGLTGALPGGFTLRRSYSALPAFAGTATRAALDALAADPRVVSIQLDHPGHARTAQSGPAIGATQARADFGLSGRGVTVAVLDTGVELAHPDLDGGVVREKCFVRGGCPPMATDTGELAPEGNGHGTHVSGTITGNGAVAAPGIAPDARLVVVRVFDDTALGRVSDWAAALDWILANNGALGVRVVNMSLGTDTTYPGPCDTEQPLLSVAVNALADAGVIVFAASGNDGAAEQVEAPACVATAVAVGATYDAALGREPDSSTYQSGCFDADAGAGSIACFSNAGPSLDLLAPGSRIRAAAVGGGSTEKRGTSQAVPHAAAVAAMLLELDPSLSVAQLEDVLEATGKPVVDPRTQRSYPRVDAHAAARAVHGSYCTRRDDGARCELSFPCDGGACVGGTCAQGVCAVVVPGFDPLPAKTGCSATAGGLATGALLLLALARARRRRSLSWASTRPAAAAAGRRRS